MGRNGFHINCLLNGDTDVQILERLIALLQEDAAGVGHIGILGVFIRGERIANLLLLGGVDNVVAPADDVHGAGDELSHDIRGVGDADQGDGIQVRQLVARLVIHVVIRILHQGHVGVSHILRDDERAGAAGIVPVGLLILGKLIPLRAGDIHASDDKVVDGGFGGSIEVEDDGQVVHDLTGLQHTDLGAPVLLGLALLHAIQTQQTVIGPGHIGSCELAAAVIVIRLVQRLEVYVVPQGDGHGGVVVCDLPGSGQLAGHIVHGDILGGPVIILAAGVPVRGPQALKPQRVVAVVRQGGVIAVIELLPIDGQLATLNRLTAGGSVSS